MAVTVLLIRPCRVYGVCDTLGVALQPLMPKYGIGRITLKQQLAMAV